jgi:hypothetical protein
MYTLVPTIETGFLLSHSSAILYQRYIIKVFYYLNPYVVLVRRLLFDVLFMSLIFLDLFFAATHSVSSDTPPAHGRVAAVLLRLSVPHTLYRLLQTCRRIGVYLSSEEHLDLEKK